MISTTPQEVLQLTTYEQLVVHWAPIVLHYMVQGMFAVLILAAGWHLANYASQRLVWLFDKRLSDPTLRNFVLEISNVGLKILLVISVATMLGIQTTSLIAALGAAGVAVGLALQGSLSNFAGGVMILLFKPFRIGDQIEALGMTAYVDDIRIFNTQLHTQDNKWVVMPNGLLANATIINYDQLKNRQLFYDVVINPDADFKLTQQVLLELASKQALILKEPAPKVVVSSLDDKGYTASLRVWVVSQQYREARYQHNEQVRQALTAAGVGMPFQHQPAAVTQTVAVSKVPPVDGDENIEFTPH